MFLQNQEQQERQSQVKETLIKKFNNLKEAKLHVIQCRSNNVQGKTSLGKGQKNYFLSLFHDKSKGKP